MPQPRSAILFILAIASVASCGAPRTPQREEVDGVEYVRNHARPLQGDPLPAPEPPEELLILEGGRDNTPTFSAVRDVRGGVRDSWGALDVHRNEIAWFDREGGLTIRMDLSAPALGLTSPVGLVLRRQGGICIDMALRRAVLFSLTGEPEGTIGLEPGIPLDVVLNGRDDLYILSSLRTDDGQEQLTRVKRYDLTGRVRPLAGADSLLLDRRRIEEISVPLPTCLALSEDGTLWAAALDYTIHQIQPGGEHRVITRTPRESRVPDWLLEERRRLMRFRVSTQRQNVTLMEDTRIHALIGLEDDCLVQTTEWHPELLDGRYNRHQSILLLDRFDADGNFQERYALELPLPQAEITLTDAVDGQIYGYAVPAIGEGPISILRFSLPRR